ncbi:MAG: hypothetical protein RR922_03325 [Clostridia bacterium]
MSCTNFNCCCTGPPGKDGASATLENASFGTIQTSCSNAGDFFKFARTFNSSGACISTADNTAEINLIEKGLYYFIFSVNARSICCDTSCSLTEACINGSGFVARVQASLNNIPVEGTEFFTSTFCDKSTQLIAFGIINNVANNSILRIRNLTATSTNYMNCKISIIKLA